MSEEPKSILSEIDPKKIESLLDGPKYNNDYVEKLKAELAASKARNKVLTDDRDILEVKLIQCEKERQDFLWQLKTHSCQQEKDLRFLALTMENEILIQDCKGLREELTKWIKSPSINYDPCLHCGFIANPKTKTP